MPCRSSSAFPSSRTSRIDDIEAPALGGLDIVGAAGFAADFAVVVVGALEAGARLCLEDSGALFTPSETEARGREDAVALAAESVGGAADAREDAVVPAVGREVVEEDRPLVGGGVEDVFEGAMDALRAGAEVVPVVAALREEAMVGLVGAADALVDFFKAAGAADGLPEAVVDVVVGLETAVLTDPCPNVPELSTYHAHHISAFLIKHAALTFFTMGDIGPPLAFPAAGLVAIGALVPVFAG